MDRNNDEPLTEAGSTTILRRPALRSMVVGGATELGVRPADVQRFYEVNWNKRIALSVPDFYSWQFIDCPDNAGTDACVVALAGDTLCGVMGVTPRPFLLDGQLLNGGELTTWVVSSDARGQGVGPAILKYLQYNYDVLIGMGITKDALSLYLRNGFGYLKAIPRYSRVYDLDAIAEYTQIDPLGMKLAKQRLAHKVGVTYTIADLNDQALERLVVDFSTRFRLFSRHVPNFRWRYDRHPCYRYDCFHVRGDGGGAVVVTRSQELPNGRRILRVMDIIHEEGGLLAALAFLDDHCLVNGYALADFFCTTSRISCELVAHGWFSALDEDFFQFPHLFEPIELRIPSTTSLIYWARQGIEKLADFSRLYITKQDADLDRPVNVVRRDA